MKKIADIYFKKEFTRKDFDQLKKTLDFNQHQTFTSIDQQQYPLTIQRVFI